MAIALIIAGTALFIVGLIYNLALTLFGVIILGGIGSGLQAASHFKSGSDTSPLDYIIYYSDDEDERRSSAFGFKRDIDF